MVTVTRVVGALLLIAGIIAYLATAMASPTALAPAGVGLVLLTLGLLAGRADWRRHLMHAALVVSLLGVLASLMPLRDLPAFLAGTAERPGAVAAAGTMAVLCLIHLALGIRSFVAARRRPA